MPSTSNHAPRLSLTKPIARTNSQPILNRDETNNNPMKIQQTSRLRRSSTMFTSDYQTQTSTRAPTERRETPEELMFQSSIVEAPLATYITNTNTTARRMESEPRIFSGLSRRRSLKVNLPQIRTSWSERNAQASNKTNCEVYNSERNYVDTCVQMDLHGHHLDECFGTSLAPTMLPQEPQYQPVQTMPFDLMQDYFRGRYSLGDALLQVISWDNLPRAYLNRSTSY